MRKMTVITAYERLSVFEAALKQIITISRDRLIPDRRGRPTVLTPEACLAEVTLIATEALKGIAPPETPAHPPKID